mmetsp:Transcript_5475/g.13991  ORF Transcript_5475/g.13991 Transcript_5475/m.13991 type:complete len:207 (+) Transcript_5475:184-804(+)
MARTRSTSTACRTADPAHTPLARCMGSICTRRAGHDVRLPRSALQAAPSMALAQARLRAKHPPCGRSARTRTRTSMRGAWCCGPQALRRWRAGSCCRGATCTRAASSTTPQACGASGRRTCTTPSSGRCLQPRCAASRTASSRAAAGSCVSCSPRRRGSHSRSCPTAPICGTLCSSCGSRTPRSSIRPSRASTLPSATSSSSWAPS